MTLVLNNHRDLPTFADSLKELAADAATVSMAVSYVKVEGWRLFERSAPQINFRKMRVVCTDQFSITSPEAIRLIQAKGASVRKYAGEGVYHPKVYLAHDRQGRPTRYLLGSANLSYSAFSSAVEAGVAGADKESLSALSGWFDSLFERRSTAITPAVLAEMQLRWKATASERSRARLRTVRKSVASGEAPTIEADDVDAMEDVFATVRRPLGRLSMDYAGNNVRNVSSVRKVLSQWPTIAASTDKTAGKQRNELSLLGFATGRELTKLGEAARHATDEYGIAKLWCRWLQHMSDAELANVRPRLLPAKRVFERFWHLRRDVRQFFIAHAQNPEAGIKDRLMGIEFLCNGSDVVESFALSDFEAMWKLVKTTERLPLFVREAYADYLKNKGGRSWQYPDRVIVPQAWRDAAREG